MTDHVVDTLQDAVAIAPVAHLALVQSRIGIGDMIWHLPHIRALAKQAGGRVTLVTRPRSAADQLLGPEDGITDVFWIERDQWIKDGRHQGLSGAARLVRDLRARRFDAAVLLTHSRSMAFAVAAAGIPSRYGYGIGSQRWFLNRLPALPDSVRNAHPYDRASAWLHAAGIGIAEPEPRLRVPDAAPAAACARLGAVPGGFVALGIASSDDWKRWSTRLFADLAARLLAEGWPRLVLAGGLAEQAIAAEILAQLDPVDAVRVSLALGWQLRDVAALLQAAAYYVGNDTGVLNIAAAVGTRAYGLFGGTPVLTHSANIVPVVPPGGSDHRAGMARITVASVLDVITRDRGAVGPLSHAPGSSPSSARPIPSGTPVA